MKTMTMIAAALIATATFGGAVQAQPTKKMLTGQEKTAHYQQDQREKAWNEQRLGTARSGDSATFGAPARQSFGRTPAEAKPEVAAPSSFGVPGSGAAFYNYDGENVNRSYGY